MLILPAIDLQNGRCVRLVQGDFARSTQFSERPEEVARRWQTEGATWLHVVDLDGAREGAPRNFDAVQRIHEAVSIPIEVGGGLRTLEGVAALLDLGIERVILGTAALKDRAFLHACLERWGERIAISLDARNGLVATDGWLETSTVSALTLAQELIGEGVARFIYTDIQRDGALSGPNLTALATVIATINRPIIASGGVAALDDLWALAKLGAEGAIVGRALYTGEVKLAEALEAIKEADDAC